MDRGNCKLHGLVRREGNYWVALVLEFDVLGTGDSAEQARRLAGDLTRSYVREQMELGKTCQQARQSAPLHYWLSFYWATLRRRILSRNDGTGGTRAFSDLMPLPC
jgi:hypothetical protein